MSDNKLLYMQIATYLKDKITSREFQANMKLPTEMELAEQFNVSRITSKRALEELCKEGLIYRVQGSGSFVSSMEEKVSIQKIPDAATVRQQRIISMVLPFKASMGRLVDAIQGATDFLNTRGYFLGVHSTGRDIYQERVMLSKLVKDGVSGIIYYPLSDSKNLEVLNTLCMENYPIVVIDKYFDSLPVSSVVSDNFNGGYEITSRLIKLGHERIAFLSDAHIEGATSIRDRYFGYCRALKDHGLEIDHDIINIGFYDILKNQDTPLSNIIRRNNYTIDRTYLTEIVNDLLKKKVTAIQAINDDIGTYIEKVCLEMGIRIPQQLSITGFDNIDISEHVDVPLTTVEQDFYQIGKRAAEIVVEYIEGDRQECTKETIPVRVIGRSSTGPLTATSGEYAV